MSFRKVDTFLTLIKIQCKLPIFSTKIAYTCHPFGEQGCVDCWMAAVINLLKIAVIIAWLTVVSDMYFATGPYNWTTSYNHLQGDRESSSLARSAWYFIILYLQFYPSWVIDGPAAILPETQRCQNEKHKLQLEFPCLLPTQYPTTIQLGNLWRKAFYVHVTISQPILKEPTPGSWQFAGVQS